MLRNVCEYLVIGFVGVVAGPMFAMQVADYITNLRGFTLRKARGQGLVEYALIAFLFLVAIAILVLYVVPALQKATCNGLAGVCPTPTPIIP